MNREQKAATIDMIAGQIEASDAVFAVDFRGLSVPQAAELRAKLRDADASFRVVKNSLTERAADKAGAGSLKALLEGPTALTFVHGDAALAAKAIADYGRAAQLLPFKGGLLGGEPLDAEEVRSISRLPARDVLYAQLVGVVASPVTGLVRALGGLLGGLAVALGQVQARKESGEIPAGEPPAGRAAPEARADAVAAAEAAEAETPGAEQHSADAEAAAVHDPGGDGATQTVEAEEAPAEVAGSEAPLEVPTESAEEAAPVAEQLKPESAPAPDNPQADASTRADEAAEANKESK